MLENDEEGYFPGDVRDVESFSQAGLMTGDEGLVLTLADGSEFQLQIVRSR